MRVPYRRSIRAFLAVLILSSGVVLAQEAPTHTPDFIAKARVADAPYWSLAGSVYVAGMTDWYTTRQFREQGIDEANPIMEPLADNGAALAAVKLASGSLVNYTSWALKKGGKRYWAAPQIAWIVLNLAVSIHNSNQMED
jgi:hypothetical protein